MLLYADSGNINNWMACYPYDINLILQKKNICLTGAPQFVLPDMEIFTFITDFIIDKDVLYIWTYTVAQLCMFFVRWILYIELQKDFGPW